MTTKTIMTTLAELNEAMDELRTTHAALTLPVTDDEIVTWGEVIAQVDAVGTAAFRLATLANENLIPALKTLKAHAQAQRDQIAMLERAFQGEAGLVRTDPNATPAQKPVDTWQILLNAADADTRLTEIDRRVLKELVAQREPSTGKATISRALVARALSVPEPEVQVATQNLRAFRFIRWENQSSGPNIYTFLSQTQPPA